MSDLHVELDPALGRRDGLVAAIRRGIHSGVLSAGTRLPSSRRLALELGMARATVVGAYEQLAAEGFLDVSHGSGTRVAQRMAPQSELDDAAEPVPSPVIADFRPGEPDLTSFPRAPWAAATRAVLRELSPTAFAYGDARGLLELRRALAAHLGRARAVVTTPEQVFVFSGFGDALETLIPTFRSMGAHAVAVETPSLPWHRAAVERSMKVVDARVDESGMRVDDVAASGADVVLTTPAHQYPLGVAMSPRRRSELVAWARDAEAWIIEDDYDGEFRYDRKPVGSLQGLSPDRVVYAGTASKSIAPGVGVGWLVVPPALVEPLAAVVRHRVTTSTIEQAVLGRFVETGGLDRHLRRMRLVYRRRRDELLALIADEPSLALEGIAAGLHLTVGLETREEERALFERAAAASVALFPLSAHYRTRPRRHGFVLGFTRPAEHAWPAALRRLRSVLTTGRDSR